MMSSILLCYIQTFYWLKFETFFYNILCYITWLFKVYYDYFVCLGNDWILEGLDRCSTHIPPYSVWLGSPENLAFEKSGSEFFELVYIYCTCWVSECEHGRKKGKL